MASGGRLISPSPEFIRIAADKQRTCETLAAAGVPVPDGRVLGARRTAAGGLSVSGRAEAGRWRRLAGYVHRERAARCAAGVCLAAAAGALHARDWRRAWRCLCGPAGAIALDAVQAANFGRRPVAVSGRRVAAGGRAGRTGDDRWPSGRWPRCRRRSVTWASTWCSAASRTAARMS